MTSGVELFFISFVFVLLSSLASGSLRCPFGVMRDGPHVGKIRSRDPPRIPWLHFLLSFCFQTWDFCSFGLAFRSSLRSRSTARPKLVLFFESFCWEYWRYCSQINRSIILFVFQMILGFSLVCSIRFGPMNFCQNPLIVSISNPLSSTSQLQAYLMSMFHHLLYSQHNSRKPYLNKSLS